MSQATANRTTGNASTESRLDVDVSDIIFHTGEPSDTPLIALGGGKLYLDGKSEPKEVAAKIKTEKATEVQYTVIEKDPLARTITVNGAVADTTTESITVASTTNAWPGDILYNINTGERMYVYTRTSATAIIVKRNLGSTSFTIGATDTLLISSYGTKQGGSKRPMRSQLGAARNRNCQIFKRSFGVTDTLLNVLTLTSKKDWDEEMAQALVEHKKDIEYAFWFNPAADSTTDADGNTVYLTRGIIAELGTDYAFNCQGSLDEDKFFTGVAEAAFQYGSSRKALFADAKLLSKLNGFARVKQQLQPKMTEYGLKVGEIETGHGMLDLVRCGVFNKHFGNTKNGYGVVLETESVAKKAIANRDTKYEVDIQTPGDDAREGQFKSEVGISVRNLAHHLVIDNM